MATKNILPTSEATCHCWGPEGQVCVAVGYDLIIYKLGAKKYEVLYTLEKHKHRVTGVDWNLKTNQIVSCSEDRNAYVWTFDKKQWNQTLVVLRVNRAALCVKWSPNGKKFAVGTSAKTIMVCNYDAEHDFWVSKSIKKSKSAILALHWHKSSLYLAAGGADHKVRVYNAKLDMDEDVQDNLFKKSKFSSVVADCSSLGYVNDVVWNPNGQSLAFCSQSSQLTLVSFLGSGEFEVQTRQLNTLPLNSIQWVDDTTLVGAGHDKILYSFTINKNSFSPAKKIDSGKKAAKKKVGVSAAFAKFQNLSAKGQSENKSSKSSTMHKFAVNNVALHPDGGVSTVSRGDRALVTWKV